MSARKIAAWLAWAFVASVVIGAAVGVVSVSLDVDSGTVWGAVGRVAAAIAAAAFADRMVAR